MKKFNLKLTEEEKQRLVDVAGALQGRAVYRDRALTMQAIASRGLEREMRRLEIRFNAGRPFPKGEVVMGRPRRAQEAGHGTRPDA